MGFNCSLSHPRSKQHYFQNGEDSSASAVVNLKQKEYLQFLHQSFKGFEG